MKQRFPQYFVLVLTTLALLLTPLYGKSFNPSLAFGASKGKQKTDPPYELRTIVIDAGHGGKDPGCLGGHSREKHLALAIALEFADRLRYYYPDLQVILTRDSDVFIPLHERAAIANEADADLFVSIHCNFMPGSEATTGSETYVMGLHTAEHNLEVAMRENESILFEDNYEQNYDYDPNSAEGHILLSMFQNVYLEHSIHFAEIVENHFHKTAHRRSRGVKQAGFVVLKETAMPSVLIEAGFLSNKQEEEFLLSDIGQQTIAHALTIAFAEYKAELEGSELPAFARPQTPLAASPGKIQGLQSTPTDKKRVVNVGPAPQTGLSPAPPTESPQARVVQPTTNSAKTAVAYQPTTQTKDWQRRGAVSPSPKRTNVAPSYPQQRPPAVIVPISQSNRTTSPARPNTIPLPTLERPAYRFCVQLAASRQPLRTDSDQWRQPGYLIEVVQEGGFYKYQARNMRSLEQAFSARANLRQRGFEDAFIVVYKGEERISVEQYQAEVK